MVVVGGGHIAGHRFHGVLSVPHGNARAGKGQHRAVIQAVAAGHEIFAGQPHLLQQSPQADVLGDAQRHGLDEERAGGVQVDLPLKPLFPLGADFVAAGGVQRDEHFADGVIHISRQILHLDHGQVAGKALPGRPLVLRALGDNALFIVSKNGNVLLRRKGAELGHHVRVQPLLVKGLPRFAVDDGTAIVGQDAAALFVQPQILCQRHDACRGAAGGQHDGHALCHGGIQCRAGAGSHFLFVIGQGAVQVQCQHPDILLAHIFLTSGQCCRPLDGRFFSLTLYCTMKRCPSATLRAVFR